MAKHTNSKPHLGSAELFHYTVPTGPFHTIPHEFEKASNSDARKHGDKFKDNVALHRPLLGVSSMSHTILVDLQTFESDILGVKTSLTMVNPLPETLVNHARLVFDKAFGRPQRTSLPITLYVAPPMSSSSLDFTDAHTDQGYQREELWWPTEPPQSSLHGKPYFGGRLHEQSRRRPLPE
ncbi:hypothetical protein NUW54_g9772 [Trametes sanguinea]|uniref:Uncharacterized protein n=1 Tax=Trametes sanguinea TaxID=158606 RepID=A0ACC1P3R9_9APHY|nr:hypothetical protein NUW54_g9772 [Trametes sanguinea]